MEEQTRCELLRFGIGRYDHYYDSVNNKGSVLLALNTFLLAGVLAAYYNLPSNPAWWYKSAAVLILVANLAVTVATLCALRPTLSRGYTGSRFWFGDVAAITSAEYATNWAEARQAEVNQDLAKQMHALACGLRGKFYWLNRAIYFLLFQLILVGLIGFANLK